MLNDVTKRTLKSALMAGAAVATVMSIAPQAYAQPTDDQSKVEKVTVTGSRIPRKDYTSNSPLTTVTSQQIKDAGATTIGLAASKFGRAMRVPVTTISSSDESSAALANEGQVRVAKASHHPS